MRISNGARKIDDFLLALQAAKSLESRNKLPDKRIVRTELIGEVLDGKYKIERELGRGGMGTVYLAIHIGTERPVAVKIISPQYMKRPEFVERFRREARAAGRLRHPNVVDVTDFGFADIPEGRVAYLVMEYLDGCTLGEVLEEEQNLPVSWTIDILEQVCSALHEAHSEGIIHRDLKPDNIWLEPNQRGGYTVKVLDFGIAKLEDPNSFDENDNGQPSENEKVNGQETGSQKATETRRIASDHTGSAEAATLLIESADNTRLNKISPQPDNRPHDEHSSTPSVADIEPGGADLQTSDPSEMKTAILAPDPYFTESGQSAAAASARATMTASEKSSSELTRVGAVLGTPLYMSPEQCRGERLDPRSDVYSIGIIAYQMLAGKTPFTGEFKEVMEAHKNLAPPPIKRRGIRRKLKQTIMSALEKDPNKRPQSAEAFATILRARSEGIFGLLRRAGMIYTEHIGKFLALSLLLFSPLLFFTFVIIAVSFARATDMISRPLAQIIQTASSLATGAITSFVIYILIGTTTWIVAHSLAIPLRPLRLRPALRQAWSKWKAFIGTGLMVLGLQILLAIFTLGIGFLITSVLWTLVGPVVMMENLSGWQAIKRSTQLVRRSLATSTAAVFIMFAIPAIGAGAVSSLIVLSAQGVESSVKQVQGQQGEPAAEQKTTEAGTINDKSAAKESPGSSDNSREINVQINNQRIVRIPSQEDSNVSNRIYHVAVESLIQLLMIPFQIFLNPFTSIIVALLYLKTRQAGGEPFKDILSKLEEGEQPLRKWQERVRKRLIQSGRIISKST